MVVRLKKKDYKLPLGFSQRIKKKGKRKKKKGKRVINCRLALANGKGKRKKVKGERKN